MNIRFQQDGGRFALLVLFFSCCVVAAATAAPRLQSQATEGKDEVFEKVDPYTKGAAEAMDKAGYESFGPFLFAEGIKTQDVEEALGNIQVLWLETKHFKIGSTLGTYKYKGDPKEDKKLDEEVKRLKARLPTVKPVKNKIDPWLRLHLYAQRLEDLYADFLLRFGLSEADFDPKTKPANLAMGEGPYLGMEAKFTVLITEKRSGTARFLKRFLNTETPSWQRWFLNGGSAFLGISMEALKEYNYDSDLALWATTASETSMNFLEAFRKTGHSFPVWFKAGYAHVMSRRIDERFVLSAVGTTRSTTDEEAARWEPRVYGLVFNKAAKPWKEMAVWTKWDDLKAQGHLIAWSRVAWLLERKDVKLRELILGMSESLQSVPEADRPKVLVERQEAALQAALGKSMTETEAEWRQFVLRNYEKK